MKATMHVRSSSLHDPLSYSISILSLADDTTHARDGTCQYASFHKSESDFLIALEAVTEAVSNVQGSFIRQFVCLSAVTYISVQASASVSKGKQKALQKPTRARHTFVTADETDTRRSTARSSNL